MAQNTTNIYSNVALYGGLTFMEENDSFPSADVGTFILKGGMLYAHVTVGGLSTWYPLSNRTQYKIHRQAIPALQWEINHGFGTTDVFVQVQNDAGQILNVGKEDIDENTFKLFLTSAMTGKAIIIAPSNMDVANLESGNISVANGKVQIDSTGIRVDGVYVLTAATAGAIINTAITTALAGITPVTKVSDITNDLGYQTAADVNTAIANTTISYNDLADKPIIPTIPTQVSAFTNNAGYITTADIADKVDKYNYYIDAGSSETHNVGLRSTYKTTVGGYIVDAESYIERDSATGTWRFKNIVPVQTHVATAVNSYADVEVKSITAHGDVSVTNLNVSGSINLGAGALATQSYVTTKIQDVVGAAPAALDTLKEIADKLATEDSAIAALTATIATKANTNSLATVATTGSYADLSGKPSIPSNYIPNDGVSTVSGKVSFIGSGNNVSSIFNNSVDIVTISSLGATGTISYDLAVQSALFKTGTATADFDLDIVFGTSQVDQVLAVGHAISFILMVTNGTTPYKLGKFKVDGIQQIVKWVGGVAPTSGNASAIDMYSFNIIKTAADTYTCIATLSKVA